MSAARQLERKIVIVTSLKALLDKPTMEVEREVQVVVAVVVVATVVLPEEAKAAVLLAGSRTNNFSFKNSQLDYNKPKVGILNAIIPLLRRSSHQSEVEHAATVVIVVKVLVIAHHAE